MNDDSNRSQLNLLKAELERVEFDLRFLRVKADQLEIAINAQGVATPPPAHVVPPSGSPASKPVLSEPFPEGGFWDLSGPARKPATPPPLPKVAPTPPIIAAEPAPIHFTSNEPELEPSAPKTFAASPSPSPEPESFEMKLGTYWFVRIGIVMVLTAMVFLGNYAYQHYWSLLGPVGKVILMYLGSGGLIAAGALLPRKQERLKNYGQVLFAGGLAAVYFTTYAAHHFPNLRIIESAVLDGLLLLAWTSFIVWLADRKKSEVMAMFAIGLAYYTALITNVGSFTLVSNILLASAAVFFLVRNRWVALTFLSLVASYGSFAYWRYYAAPNAIAEFPANLSLCGYWAIFTAAVFLSRHADFAGERRAGFLTFNNAAAFALLTISLLRHESSQFWQLALAAGAILLTLSYFAAKFIADDELPSRAYLAQGILLSTVGLISKFSGPTLALVLAMESALLVIFSTQWKSKLLRFAAIIVAMLSSGWLIYNLRSVDPGAWAKAAGIVALLLFNAIWLCKHDPENENPNTIREVPAFFAALGLITWCVATFALAAPLEIAPILSFTALGLTALHYLFRAREVTLLSQGLLAAAQLQMLFLVSDKNIASTWTPFCVVAISLGMALWWRHQKILSVEAPVRRAFEILSALAAGAITQFYLPQVTTAASLLTASWILTFAWTAIGIVSKSWPIAAAGQMFLVTASVKCAYGMLLRGDLDRSHHSLELIGAAIALGALAYFFSKRKPDSTPLRAIPHLYQWLAAFLIWAWARVHFDQTFIVLAIVFAISLVIATRGIRYVFPPAIMLATIGLIDWIATDRTDAIAFQNLFAILILAASQILARKKSAALPLAEGAHQFWIGLSSGALWLFMSWFIIERSAGTHFYLTASWAIFAFVLFGIGFSLHERTYRWAALTVLACAIGRVVILDVWKLETVYRMFSFLALGIVLLALGYFYTRFQEKITKWL
jgi:uncharacterized membrane protein